jgi:hypothetical protein
MMQHNYSPRTASLPLEPIPVLHAKERAAKEEDRKKRLEDESSVLVQVRTGRIGLAKYLYSRHVPGVLSSQCRCGGGEETPHHITLFCKEESDAGTLYGWERERAGRSTIGA